MAHEFEEVDLSGMISKFELGPKLDNGKSLVRIILDTRRGYKAAVLPISVRGSEGIDHLNSTILYEIATYKASHSEENSGFYHELHIESGENKGYWTMNT